MRDGEVIEQKRRESKYIYNSDGILEQDLNTHFDSVSIWTWREERKEGEKPNVSGSHLRVA